MPIANLQYLKIDITSRHHIMRADTAYATTLLTAAESLYAFAKANPGPYTSSVPGAAQFYS